MWKSMWLLLAVNNFNTFARDHLEGEDDVSTVIGIDLGTKYSRVGVSVDGRIEIIAIDQFNRIRPSCAASTSDGCLLISDVANHPLAVDPKRTICNTKRVIGPELSDSKMQRYSVFHQFTVREKDLKPLVTVQTSNVTKVFAPEEISSMVFGKVKETAEAYLGKKVTHAVVTVPRYFTDAQRETIKNAATISGLIVMGFIFKPTAVAIAYGLNEMEVEKNVLIFDLGGGSFDVTLLRVEYGIFEILATNGDTLLAGKNFTQCLVDHFINLYQKKRGKNVTKDNRAVQILEREIEKAKRVLSSVKEVRVEIENFIDGEDFSETLSRVEFEELCADLFKSTLKPLQKVLEVADMNKEDVEEIILVGGSTRIPKVQQLVKEFFDGKQPLSRGNIEPDEAVAYGATIRAGLMVSDERDSDYISCIQINPLSFGIETAGGIMTKLIPKNTVIPVKKSQIFSTVFDDQNTVTIHVLEGERSMAKDNHMLSKFDLSGIPSAPRGQPQIEVTFVIDASLNLGVSATDLKSNIRQETVIPNDPSRLSADSIEKMINDAEKYEAHDTELKRQAESRTDYSLTNQIAVSDNQKEEVDRDLDEL